jgi:hypothetical protein
MGQCITLRKTVAVVGLDGAGKSSLINTLKDKPRRVRPASWLPLSLSATCLYADGVALLLIVLAVPLPFQGRRPFALVPGSGVEMHECLVSGVVRGLAACSQSSLRPLRQPRRPCAPFALRLQSWTIWDCSGFGRYRDLWERFVGRGACPPAVVLWCSALYAHQLHLVSLAVDALVFVIDGNDTDRLGTVRDEFRRVLRHPGMCIASAHSKRPRHACMSVVL